MEALRNVPIQQRVEKAEPTTARQIGRIAGTIFKGAVEVGKAVTMLPFSCGYVNFNGLKRHVHDHDGRKMVSEGWVGSKKVEYDEARHGPLIDWVDEGKPIPGFSRGNHGETAIHQHKSGSLTGVHEYKFE